MKINIGFGSFVSVIEFEPFMGENIEDYKNEFEKWFFYEKLENDVPIYPNQLKYKYFNAEPIVDWMNQVAPECNARIIAFQIASGNEDTSLPYMCF